MNVWETPLRKKKILFDKIGYTPSEEQKKIHASQARFKQIAGGERGGKSFVTAMEMLVWIVLNPEGLFWIVGPDYEQCHAEFEYIVRELLGLGIVLKENISMPKQGSWTLTTEFGGRVETKTSQDVRKLASVAPDGIAMVEAAQQAEDAYLRCRGRVGEKRGPMALSGTFEREAYGGWYQTRWRRWQSDNDEQGESFSLPTWSNTFIFPGGRDDPEIKSLEATYPKEEFLERFGAKPCPPSTLVFREFDPEKHVTEDADYISGEPVQLWIDPGYAHAYAIVVVQLSHDIVFQIDEVYRTGLTAEEMIDECKSRDWWEDVKGGVMDVAGRQHPGAESQSEIWKRKTGLTMTMNRVPIVDGILRHRTFLKDPASGQPRLYHHPRCKGTIEEYSRYQYREERRTTNASEKPIDRANHCVIGDTEVDMPGGKQKIKDLVGTEPYVYCCIDGEVRVRQAYDIHKTRENVPIVQVMMDKGDLYCTPDHLIMLSDGTYRRAEELETADSLMALNRYVDGYGYTSVCMTGNSANTKREHRFVWSELNGPIPDGWQVHHKNSLAWDNHPDNLIALSLAEHNSRHHKGKTLSSETKRKIAAATARNWEENYEERAEIARENAEAAHKANEGRSPSEETREKISEASKKMWEDEEFRREASERCKGRTHSEEAKEKMRQAKLEWWQAEENQARREELAEQNRKHGHFVDNHRVIAVVPCGKADVYDMNVREAHNFVAEGVVIHNSMKAIAYGLVANFGFVGSQLERPRVNVYLRSG